MKIKLDKKNSNLIKENTTYTVIDNTDLENLVVSKTILHPKKETTGHAHEGQEEVYHFISGKGTMQIGVMEHEVKEGDIFSIPDGAFHKVWNHSNKKDLIFICVFDGRRSH
tara:strand:+ start:1352 stop:1684 length:333 start_codon:yes stop_codon:yes gene_type:complete